MEYLVVLLGIVLIFGTPLGIFAFLSLSGRRQHGSTRLPIAEHSLRVTELRHLIADAVAEQSVILSRQVEDVDQRVRLLVGAVLGHDSGHLLGEGGSPGERSVGGGKGDDGARADAG